MTVRVKICGLKSRETMTCALDAGADLVGLMFYPPSPRYIDPEDAASLAGMARGRADIIAVTVDPDDRLLDSIVDAVDPDMIQVQGNETPARVTEIAARTGKPVIKAIRVSSPADVASAQDYADSASLVMFEAKAPGTLANALPGGNGLIFDWSLLKQHGVPTRFMLAGGLNSGNVARAIAATGAGIVDVSSGVETSPGQKDCTLIRNFIEAAKAAR